VLTGTTVLTIGTANFGPGGSLLTATTPAGAPVPLLSASDPDGTGNGTWSTCPPTPRECPRCLETPVLDVLSPAKT
jgi:hypothetical protein